MGATRAVAIHRDQLQESKLNEPRPGRPTPGLLLNSHRCLAAAEGSANISDYERNSARRLLRKIRLRRV